jgi:cell shape-determining protein MreD
MFKEKSISKIVILHLFAILLVILNLSDVRIVGLSHVFPLFDLMAVFYFAVFKNIFGLWFVFLLGTWNDALNSNPIGTTSICYILLVKLFALLNSKLLIRENFKLIWQQFIAFCCCFLVLKWTILSIMSSSFYDITNVIVQMVISSIFYVLTHKFFDHLSKKLLEEN